MVCLSSNADIRSHYKLVCETIITKVLLILSHTPTQ